MTSIRGWESGSSHLVVGGDGSWGSACRGRVGVEVYRDSYTVQLKDLDTSDSAFSRHVSPWECLALPLYNF